MLSTPTLTPKHARSRPGWQTLRRSCALTTCVILAMLVTGACEWLRSGGDGSVKQTGESAADHRGSGSTAVLGDDSKVSIFTRPLERVAVDFRVHLLSAPRGTFGPDSQLWSIARGTIPDSDLALHLASNGFRAAIGRNSDRDTLTKYLDGTPGVRMAMDEVTPDVDRPVSVELGPGPAWSSIFIFNRRGALRGMEFVDIQLRFIMRFEFRSANLREIMVRLVPEVEEPPGPVRWQRDESGQYRELPEERKHTFQDLEIAAEIPEGGFLLIGPQAAAGMRESLLGCLFFSEAYAAPIERAVQPASQPAVGEATPRDRVYIISPIIRFLESPAPKGARL